MERASRRHATGTLLRGGPDVLVRASGVRLAQDVVELLPGTSEVLQTALEPVGYVHTPRDTQALAPEEVLRRKAVKGGVEEVL
eukprot:2995104-Rhodomonas_salina.1